MKRKPDAVTQKVDELIDKQWAQVNANLQSLHVAAENLLVSINMIAQQIKRKPKPPQE